ncbi:hypothetical protein ACLMJV_31480 [Sinorhizobium meliloti]|uniref:hypothetical protein n=1 Tax=Rhizobium meliloti TaxID=382 RepID=UPI00398CB94E
MNQVHSKKIARKYMSVMTGTQAKEGLSFCFAVGTSVIAGQRKPVVLVRKKGLKSLRRVLEDMHYKTTKGVQEPSEFRFLRSGTGRTEEGVIVVRLAKGGMAKFPAMRTQMRLYFKNMGVTLPAMQEAEPLTEEELNLFEIAAKATSNELPSDDDEATSDFTSDDDEATSYFTSDDDEATSDFTSDDDEATSDFTSDDDEATSDFTSDDDQATVGTLEGGDAEEALSEGLKQTVTTSAASVAEHAVRLSRQTGQMQTAELVPLTNKIANWLEGMLASTPPEEQENALHNFTCRLLLMLAYDDNLRNLQYVDEAPEGDEMDGSAKQNIAGVEGGVKREPINIDGIDSRAPIGKDEVVKGLFHMIRAAAQQRRLYYSLENARSDRIAEMVSSQWPKEEGQAASKRETLERLMAVVERGGDDLLIALLSLSKTDKIDEFDAVVRTIEKKWQAYLDAALVHWEDTKSKIETYDEERRGATWEFVDDLFQGVNDVVSEEFAELVEQLSGERFGAIERAEAVVEALLQRLDENDVVQLLENPPAVFGPNSIGKTLRDGLSTVGSELNRVRNSGRLRDSDTAPAA